LIYYVHSKVLCRFVRMCICAICAYVRGKVFCALSDVRGNVFLDVKGCVNHDFSLKKRLVRHGLFPCFSCWAFLKLFRQGQEVLVLRGVDGVDCLG
jgi:hypothetical protein